MEKRLLTIVVLMLLALPVLSQNLVSSFLEGMGSNTKRGITQINVSGRMLRHAAKNDPDIDANMKKLFENIDKISVVTGLSVDDKQKRELEKCLTPYEELMSVAEEEQTIYMYTKETKGQIEEFAMCVLSDNIMILVSITGKIDLNQLARLSESTNIDGMEHLNKIKDKKK